MDIENLLEKMTLKEKILNRRSIREFSQKKVEKEKILELIEMAIQAPSASNAQPWKFLIVQNQATKSAMGQAVIEEEKQI